MKKNLGTFWGSPRLGVGAVIIGLWALTVASRADIVVVDNTTVPGTTPYQQLYQQAQVFTMGANEDLSKLTLVLSGTGSRDVQIWNWASGAPTTMVLNGDLGNISQAVNTVSAAGVSLTGGNTYAVVLGLTGANTLGWGYVASTAYSSGDGSSLPSGGGLYYNNSGWTPVSGNNFRMSLTAVPEVPITGIFMGIGALAIAAGHSLRRKFRPSLSNS